MDTRETAIFQAISDFNTGVYRSVRAAARAYNIPRSTLQHRLAGTTTSAISHHDQQRLSPAQEEFLTEWILEEGARGYPPTIPRVREMANRILRANGDNTPVGKGWISGFKRRNPRVKTVIGRRIEAPRAEAASPELIRAFLELFEATRVRLGIRTDDMYNMDETGTALGICTNT